MMYIVGLGNPGEKHAKERHNVGWMVLDVVVKTYGLPEPVVSGKFSGRISEGVIDGEAVTVLYPDTYMNNSGAAVRKLVPKGEESQVLVIYDDIDIPLGELKLSKGRGDGGHNGVKSVIASLGTKEFMRLRIGILGKGWFGQMKRPSGDRLPKFVLADFKLAEQKEVEAVSQKASQVLRTILKEGIGLAMNKYN